MDVEIILIALSPIFLIFIAYEFLKHRQNYVIKDSLANTALALMHQGADAIALLFLMPIFYWLYEFRLLDIELSFLSLFFAFLLQDFLYYWFHRASHHIHWLWSAHVVHHSSTEMNFSTAFRQSIMYPITGMWLFWMPMILIGFDPELINNIFALVLTALMAFFYAIANVASRDTNKLNIVTSNFFMASIGFITLIFLSFFFEGNTMSILKNIHLDMWFFIVYSGLVVSIGAHMSLFYLYKL